MSDSTRKFPIGLTIATAISLAILIGLGVWQMQRLAWKEDLLTRMEALKTAPALPIETVLARHKTGADVAWTRVTVRCRPRAGAAAADWVRNGVREGEIVWRIASTCDLPAGPYGEILVDRGVINGSTGAVEAPKSSLPPVIAATGLLAPLGELSKAAVANRPEHSPELMLMAEREDPAPAGVTPAPQPPELTNRHLEYALTWFGLAGALLAVYVALLRRRLKRS